MSPPEIEAAVEAALTRTGRVGGSVAIAAASGEGAPRVSAFVVPAVPELQALPPGSRWLAPNRHELAVHSRTEAAYFYREVFERECYLGGGVTLDDVDVAFDVGANVGMFSLFLATRRPGVRIYAFEPVPTLFRLLERNLRAHRIDARPFNCALGERAGHEVLTFYPRSSGMSSFEPRLEEEREILLRHVEVARRSGQPGIDLLMGQLDGFVRSRLTREEIAVPVRTLSEVIGGEGIERIDLLKIDVQKTELHVLRGLRDEHWERIRQLALEAHDVRGRLEALQELLTSRGFEVTVEQDEDLVGTALHNVYAVSTRPFPRGASAGGEVPSPPTIESADDPALVAELRRSLERSLPAGYVPTRFTVLARLPRTAAGAVDREALLGLERA